MAKAEFPHWAERAAAEAHCLNHSSRAAAEAGSVLMRAAPHLWRCRARTSDPVLSSADSTVVTGATVVDADTLVVLDGGSGMEGRNGMDDGRDDTAADCDTSRVGAGREMTGALVSAAMLFGSSGSLCRVTGSGT